MRSKRWMTMMACVMGISTSVLASCLSDSVNDCERNPNLECFWSRFPSPPEGCVPSISGASVPNVCGVFVSASGGNDSAEGTKEKPVRSLAKAIELASQGARRVYACAQDFEEAVEVPSGTEIYGGLACEEGWAYIGGTAKTTIAPDSEVIALTLKGGEGTIHIEDVVARAKDAETLGGSSIAVLVDEGAAEFVRCELVAGAGREGENGQAPSEPPGPMDPNDPAIKGEAGTVACMGLGSGNPGGAGAVNAICNVSFGGDGGKGRESVGMSGFTGGPQPIPNPDGWGLGGAADDGSGCNTGQQGMNGAEGGPGVGGTELGTIDALGYTGATGQQGAPGEPGQGGGGGSGAKGKPGCNGASGGGGGAGGCAGKGGLGGKPGGSSIALVSLNATLALRNVVLEAGDGGAGGIGAYGQVGGVGGNGGYGGLGNASAPPPYPACKGGDGGQGGSGGMGGGGRGGHSIAIAFKGKDPMRDGVSVQLGTAGLGGSGLGPGGDGADGVEAVMQEF
jgi:hypothetical protein